MGRHVIVGAGPVGQGHGPGPGGGRATRWRWSPGPARGPTPRGRTAAADASDPVALAAVVGSARRPLQLRQPALPPLARAVAADGGGDARGGRRRRGGAGHHGQPLRLRPGRPPHDRGRPPGRHRHQGPGPGRHVGRGARRPPGRPGPGDRGPRLGLLRTRRGRDQLLRPQRGPACWPVARSCVLGDPDVPHSRTYVPDVGRTLAVLGTDERAWGRPWHVPSATAGEPARSWPVASAPRPAPPRPGGRHPSRCADGGWDRVVRSSAS